MRVLCLLVLTIGLLVATESATPFDKGQHKHPGGPHTSTSRRPYTTVRPGTDNGAYIGRYPEHPKKKWGTAPPLPPQRTTKKSFTTRRPTRYTTHTTKRSDYWSHRTGRPQSNMWQEKPDAKRFKFDHPYQSQAKPFDTKHIATVAPAYATHRPAIGSRTTRSARVNTYQQRDALKQVDVYQSQPKPLK